jgi:hypothetical protein
MENRGYQTGENPFVQFGPEYVEPRRSQEEVWTDPKGITWQQKNGYRVRVNKNVDAVRESLKQVCSKCGKDIRLTGNRFDDKLFPKTGMCHDCLVDYEQELMLTGKFDAYEKRKVLSNQLAYLKDVKSKLEESVTYLEQNQKITFVNEFGDVESWTNECRDTLLEGAKSDLDKVNNDIKDTEDLINSIAQPT